LDLDAFDKLLDEILHSGLAYDADEHSDGISAVGFAFTDLAGEIHAISVPVPSSRFIRQQLDIETAVRRTASIVQKVMESDLKG
jgi:DNA-binding IclR family transcriptional regulator